MVSKDLAYLLRRLQLGAVEAVLPRLYQQAKTENWGYDQFLCAALETAATTRAERAVERRIREAGFPSTTKTLDSYDFASQPSLKKGVILQLATMDFVRQHDVAIFLGPTGTGKSHLSIALGIKACQAGFPVRFTTAADLIATLTQAHRQHRFEAALRQYTKPPLLICDELGYIPFDADGAALFFQLVSRRYEKGSMIVSSNLPFSGWGDTFGNATAASAIIDRLVHHAEIIVLKGSSYRLRGKEQVVGRDKAH
jgi:DNA replication protein DnaC